MVIKVSSEAKEAIGVGVGFGIFWGGTLAGNEIASMVNIFSWQCPPIVIAILSALVGLTIMVVFAEVHDN